ncbi:MAG: hypothetical protein AAB150_06340 [Pseudomonadota bacterium]
MWHIKVIHKFIFVLLALTVTNASADTINTNEDVIKLIKAGLGDAAVLQAIENSNSKFDTSADALIALKQSGASDAIIQRVLAKSSLQSSPSNLERQRSGNQCVDGAPDGQMALLDEGRQRNVPRAKSNLGIDANASTVLRGIGNIFSFGFVPVTAKGQMSINGTQAGTRLEGNQPVITSIGIRTDSSPDEAFALVKLAVRDGSRYLEVGEATTSIKGTKNETKYPPEVIVPLDITPTQKGCTYTAQGGRTYTLNRFSVKPKSTLIPGEYALVLLGGQMVFDFGVDKQ